jgi:hypothetical protein
LDTNYQQLITNAIATTAANEKVFAALSTTRSLLISPVHLM